MFSSDELRHLFLNYFEKKEHRVVPSSPLIPMNDPTLLFTNAGMVQFKSVFLGEEERDYKRAVSIQKCLRAGGKHNDLENVGRTTRHHTFFEMLGNFSFGDYFKELAIEFAWEFLIDVANLPTERLWVSIFKDDNDSFEIWCQKIGLPEERIVRLSESDNFWQMGDTGPCGPCSEIIIDQGEDVGCGKKTCGVGCDCDRYLEIWNLVFMQFNRDSAGNLTPLPAPSIDTGMGLERLASVVQGKSSNFHSDLFSPIISDITNITGVEYGKGKETDTSINVIADHIRAITLLISEGVVPSNEGRGYVLRRIIRRASRHAKIIGMKEPFLYKLIGSVVDCMRSAYPGLLQSTAYIEKITKIEEERFMGTLNGGLLLLTEVMAETEAKGLKEISGRDIFKLYDTFGFPVDLASEIASEHGFKIDEEGFKEAMEEQRRRAKASWVILPGTDVKEIYKSISHKSIFVGYETTEVESKIVAIIKGDSTIDSAVEADEIEIVLDKTPFYAESGGQVGDRGYLSTDHCLIKIHDTIKPLNELYIHKARVLSGEIRYGEKVHTLVSTEHREATARNHTATHLLHTALREILGDHIKQAGSLVSPERLRFDFTHFNPLNITELDKIEDLVNRKVREDIPVTTEVMTIEDAISTGAIALFGEKYGDVVRVVGIDTFSKELCGGTHISHTGEIGIFKIIHEGGISAGVRRIEALTGESAYNAFKEEERELMEIAKALKTTDLKVYAKVEKLLSTNKELQREVETLKEKFSSIQAAEMSKKYREVCGVKVLAVRVDNLKVADMRSLGDSLRERLKSGILVIGSRTDNMVSWIAMVTKDLSDRFNAGEIIKEIAAITEGTGGGRAEIAQGGGRSIEKVNEALESVYSIVEKMSKGN
ncbi:MAG: alanine--tRNA ligase [Nitrospirota bacterium]